jgi:hypothetical protein
MRGVLVTDSSAGNGGIGSGLDETEGGKGPRGGRGVEISVTRPKGHVFGW